MPYFVALGKAVSSGRGLLEAPEEVTPKCLCHGVPDSDALAAAAKNLDRLVGLGVLVKQNEAPVVPVVSAAAVEQDMRPHAPVAEPDAQVEVKSGKGGKGKSGKGKGGKGGAQAVGG